MKIFNNGLKLTGSIIMAAVLSFFLCISMNIICSAIFTSEIGYDAFVYETNQSTEPIEKYEYLYTDNDGDGKDEGTDTKKAEYEDKKYIVVTSPKRTELVGSGKVVFWVTTQLLSLIMVIAFASNSTYKQGFKDNNLVKIGQTKKDMIKGFKIGLVANIPFILLFVFAIVKASSMRKVLYAFLNSHFYAIIMAITGESEVLSQIGAVKFVLLGLLLAVVPLISGIAYILGYKEINLADKIMYKKEVK